MYNMDNRVCALVWKREVYSLHFNCLSGVEKWYFDNLAQYFKMYLMYCLHIAIPTFL